MRRGTTPTLTFTLPYDIAISALYITFVQGDKTILEKTIDDVTIDGNKITLSLTQDDTLLFEAPLSQPQPPFSKMPDIVLIQLRLRDENGNAVASQIIKTTVDAILKDGVI